ncbi:MAG: DNA polymerase III subunit delta [Patescibacteria group bacterium]|nr:DNA polymerase III subunit delta [Patescibacteria group bacterium]
MKNIIFLYGEDAYSIFQEMRGLKNQFIEKRGEHNFENFFGDDIADIKLLTSALETFPFIGDKRMVLLRDPWNTRKSTWRSHLADFLDHIPATTIFLIAETTKPDKREVLFKKLLKASDVHEFPKLRAEDLAKKAVEMAMKFGNKISMPIAIELCNRVGMDGFRLENEIQKLALAAADNEITSLLIQEIVAPADAESNIFALTDALGARKLPKAIVELQNLLEKGENEFYLLATISNHFRSLLLVSDWIQSNKLNAGNIAKELKLHPFVANKALSQIRNFSLSELRKIYQKLADLDFALKSFIFFIFLKS